MLGAVPPGAPDGRRATVRVTFPFILEGKSTRTGRRLWRDAPPRPGELFRSALDTSKAKAVLGWAPEWTFDDGLRQLVDWFRKEAR